MKLIDFDVAMVSGERVLKALKDLNGKRDCYHCGMFKDNAVVHPEFDEWYVTAIDEYFSVAWTGEFSENLQTLQLTDQLKQF